MVKEIEYIMDLKQMLFTLFGIKDDLKKEDLVKRSVLELERMAKYYEKKILLNFEVN